MTRLTYDLRAYDLEILIQSARDCLEAQSNYCRYVHIPATHKDKTTQQITSKHENFIAAFTAFNIHNHNLANMCALVGADVFAVIALTKAMDRHDRRYETCTQLPRTAKGQDQMRNALSLKSPYYRSTGRRKAWTE